MEEDKGIFGFCSEKRNLFIASFFGMKEFLTFYILFLLTKGDCYGEEISKKISELLKGLWSPNPGFIYPVLKKLERHTLIKGNWTHEMSHPRYVYKITDKGTEEYKKLYKNFSIRLDEFVRVVTNVKQEVFKNE